MQESLVFSLSTICDSRHGSRQCHQEEQTQRRKLKKKAHNGESAKRLIGEATMKIRHSAQDIRVCFTSAVMISDACHWTFFNWEWELSLGQMAG